MADENDEYDDIIGLHRPAYPGRPCMPMSGRAAQFAPFAALAGFDDAVPETARTTCDDIVPADDYLGEMSERLRLALERDPHPRVRLSCFIPDATKHGGSMLTFCGRIRSVDRVFDEIVFEDGRTVRLSAVRAISC